MQPGNCDAVHNAGDIDFDVVGAWLEPEIRGVSLLRPLVSSRLFDACEHRVEALKQGPRFPDGAFRSSIELPAAAVCH